MKKYSIIAILAACALSLTASCDPMGLLIGEQVNDSDGKGILYILSEGQWNGNDSRLVKYNLETGKVETWKNGTTYCAFEGNNDRLLGDGANDIIRYGGKLYVAVSNSSTLEILDVETCTSLTQIQMTNDSKEARQPRFLTAKDKYVYACCFDGTVSKIDTATMKIAATVTAGRNPDGLGISNGKLYVSNSGGMDFANPDTTVSVIDLETFTEIKKITVPSNPGQICVWGYNVFVLTRGLYNYETWSYDLHLQVIDSRTDRIEKTLDIPIGKMSASGGCLWYYETNGKVGAIDALDFHTVDSCFVKDSTSISTPYGIMADAANKRVYLTDAGNYVTPGNLLCFDFDGKLLFEVKGVGICPNTIVRY